MRLEKLQYQFDAIDKVIAAIDQNSIVADANFCANPLLADTRPIDVKMETGTGKTYVYTRLMYQMQREFGFFKFIIIVPGVAIKEGTKLSIQSDEWNRHFRRDYLNTSINLGVINAGDFTSKKGKRKQMPESLRSFCDASGAGAIEVLLLNDAMLASKSMSDSDYDSTLLGSISCPLDGLKATRPIVIIDEPHRFKRENKAWKNITERLCPQLIIRFGATFPETFSGRGRGKTTVIDYENLVYNLNAVQAFNEGLVKGVHILYPSIGEDGPATIKYKVEKINSTREKKSVVFKKMGTKKNVEISIGDDLVDVDHDLRGVVLDSISSANSAMLSNRLELHVGMELLPATFAAGYQEIMLQQALDTHFENEKKYFHRGNDRVPLPRIKTNSLFFIDSIASFRGHGDEKKGWLRTKFEQLLTDKLRSEKSKARGGYKEYLEASLQDIRKNIAGYFAEDNAQKGDEAIQEEVDKVLRDKEQSLTFKNKDGTWNVCRFFFSKWTLCEGWDNPNVFVIAKLRSSGSETRKIQEVGRGLRLPFDELGTRARPVTGGEDFRLTYLIDYSERDFAKKLVGEINADGGRIVEGKLNDAIMDHLVRAGHATSKALVKARLLMDGVIDEHDVILDMEKLFSFLPDDSEIRLKNGRITGVGLPERPKVHLNRANFKKLNELWEKVTKRYVLQFEKVPDGELARVLVDIFSQNNLFVSPTAAIVEESIQRGEGNVTLLTGPLRSTNSTLGVVYYGEFLARLNKRTSLPIPLLHGAIIAARKETSVPLNFFNTQTIENAVRAWEDRFSEIFAQKFSYSSLDYRAQTSIFTSNGEFVAELEQSCVGTKKADSDIVDRERYLYDEAVYDSEIEHDILRIVPPERVIVYGKLPRMSIKIPMYTGGTTSPDFVYAIRGKKSNDIELHLVVEAKSENQRASDRIAVRAQEVLFDFLKDEKIKWRLETDAAKLERELKMIAGD